MGVGSGENAQSAFVLVDLDLDSKAKLPVHCRRVSPACMAVGAACPDVQVAG